MVADQHLSLLEAYETAKETMTESNVAALHRAGVEIREAKHATPYSNWVYEVPGEVTALESRVEASWKVLSELSAKKLAILSDDLKRESFKEKIRLWVNNHKVSFTEISAWCDVKLAYLAVKEEVPNSESAKQHLSLLEAFETDKTRYVSGPFYSRT